MGYDLGRATAASRGAIAYNAIDNRYAPGRIRIHAAAKAIGETCGTVTERDALYDYSRTGTRKASHTVRSDAVVIDFGGVVLADDMYIFRLAS